MSQARYLFLSSKPARRRRGTRHGSPVAHAQTGDALELETLDVIATAQEELKQAPAFLS